MTIEHPQIFIEEYCNIEKEYHKFVTHANNSNLIICCSCGYTKERSKRK